MVYAPQTQGNCHLRAQKAQKQWAIYCMHWGHKQDYRIYLCIRIYEILKHTLAWCTHTVYKNNINEHTWSHAGKCVKGCMLAHQRLAVHVFACYIHVEQQVNISTIGQTYCTVFYTWVSYLAVWTTCAWCTFLDQSWCAYSAFSACPNGCHVYRTHMHTIVIVKH